MAHGGIQAPKYGVTAQFQVRLPRHADANVTTLNQHKVAQPATDDQGFSWAYIVHVSSWDVSEGAQAPNRPPQETVCDA